MNVFKIFHGLMHNNQNTFEATETINEKRREFVFFSFSFQCFVLMFYFRKNCTKLTIFDFALIKTDACKIYINTGKVIQI